MIDIHFHCLPGIDDGPREWDESIALCRAAAEGDALSSGVVSQRRSAQAKFERDYAEKLNLYRPESLAMQQRRAQMEKGRQHLASTDNYKPRNSLTPTKLQTTNHD